MIFLSAGQEGEGTQKSTKEIEKERKEEEKRRKLEEKEKKKEEKKRLMEEKKEEKRKVYFEVFLCYLRNQSNYFSNRKKKKRNQRSHLKQRRKENMRRVRKMKRMKRKLIKRNQRRKPLRGAVTKSKVKKKQREIIEESIVIKTTLKLIPIPLSQKKTSVFKGNPNKQSVKRRYSPLGKDIILIEWTAEARKVERKTTRF
jgi:hypothetical protein